MELYILLIQRVLAVKNALSTVLEEHCWDNLHTSQWKVLASLFAQYTSFIGGEDYTTVSSGIPITMEINFHLEESRQSPEVSSTAGVLLTLFNTGFDM